MSKRKQIILLGETVDQRPFGPAWKRQTKLEWIGPRKPGKKHVGYLRFECDGMYLGSPSERQARQLLNWLKEHFEK